MQPLEHRRLFAGGSFDPSFGGGTTLVTNFTDGSTVLNDVAVTPDGGTLAGGYFVRQANGEPVDVPQMALAKYRFDGSLDPTFGAAGQIVATPRGIKAALDLALLDDGSFIVIGSSASGYSTRANLMLKFTPDGRVDTSFGSNGRVTLPMSAAALSVGVDGAVYVAGQIDRDGAIMRYSTRGRLDTTFADSGTFLTSAAFVEPADTTFVFDSVAVDSRGRIVAAGTRRDTGSVSNPTNHFDVRAIRLDTTGSLDIDFGGDAGFFSAANTFDTMLPNEGTSVGALTLGADDAIFLTFIPHEGQIPLVAKLTIGGRIDNSFSTDGVTELSVRATRFPLAPSVVEQVDGKLIFAGAVERSGRSVFAVERLDPTGAPDPTYGVDGVATVTYKRIACESRAVALAPDGSLVVGGIVGSVQPGGINDSRRFALARLFREEGPAGQLIPKTLRISQSGFVFDVIWRDDDVIDQSRIDGGDLRIFGADGIARKAKLSSVAISLDGKMITARYRLPAIDGVSFSQSDNGSYAVKVFGSQVFDETGASTTKRTLGAIRVRIV